MPTSIPSPRFVRLTAEVDCCMRLRRLILVAILALIAWPTAADEAVDQKKVLVIYASAPGAQITTVGDRELRRRLGAVSGGVDYYSEFIDQGRYEDGDYHAAFEQFVALKYKGHTFDVVVAMDHLALDFVDRHRAALFPEAPIVFFSSRRIVKRPAHATGINALINFHSTMTLAAALQPDVTQVFVVNGLDRSYEELARAQFKAFERRFTFTYLSGLATEDLEARLSTLPPHSLVYYLNVTRDGANRNVNPVDYLERLATVANAPTYCWATSAMDRAVVGGSLRSLDLQVSATADLVLRILRGESADSIPISTPDLNVAEVDWRQLQRWKISESRIPPGTIVRFRDPSLWAQHKRFILGGVAVLVAQFVLIAGLLAERVRRRRAEDAEREGLAKLQKSFDRIHTLGQRLLTAQDNERSRIARELHDDIGQQVTLLAIDLDLLSASDPTSPAKEAAGRAQGIARSLHDLSHRVHPSRPRLVGLVAALEGLQRDLSVSGVTIDLTHNDVPASLPTEITLCLFRVAQEALQNAVRYSGARRVAISLVGSATSLALAVADEGVGFDVDEAMGTGLGLISMAERAEALGGEALIRSTRGSGTRIEVTVPLPVV